MQTNIFTKISFSNEGRKKSKKGQNFVCEEGKLKQKVLAVQLVFSDFSRIITGLSSLKGLLKNIQMSHFEETKI